MCSMKKLTDLVLKQIANFFPEEAHDAERISKAMDSAYQRAQFCFSRVNNKYYSEFNVLHSGQYAAFLYFLSNSIFKDQKANSTSEKIYYLNKIMHGFDLYYQIDLPQVFFWEHPVGTVFGRAKYSDRFVIYQNCTVGGSLDKNNQIQYPEFGEDVTLFSYACVLGQCKIGKNTIISSHAYVLNRDIPDNSIVFGHGKDLVIKENKKQLGLFKSI